MKQRHLPFIALTLGLALVLSACAQTWGQSGPGGMMGGQGGMMGNQDGMMGGQGGMMGGQGSMMSNMPMMSGMMGYHGIVTAPLSPEQTKAIADGYLASLNNPDLKIAEFEEYSHNFYLSLIEQSTGRGAIEVIIDRYDSSLYAEPQSMMWNGKYGMMGSYQQTEMTVSPEKVLQIAQDFLNVVYPGTKAGEIVAYYGYYTVMTTFEGKHYGMLSVNGYTGQIWYHTWHGMFISEVESLHNEN